MKLTIAFLLGAVSATIQTEADIEARVAELIQLGDEYPFATESEIETKISEMIDSEVPTQLIETEDDIYKKVTEMIIEEDLK